MNHVDIKNLLKSDIVLKRPEIIEKAIKDALRAIPELRVIPEDLSFSFLDDSTVDSPDIPIVIKVELITDVTLTNMRANELKLALAMKIWKQFRRVLGDFRGGTDFVPEVKVSVKSFDPTVDGYYDG